MRPRTIDLQKERAAYVPFETSKVGESLVIERRAWHPRYIKEQHQIRPPRNLETALAHTLNSLSSSSLDALSGCDERLEGQRLKSESDCGMLKKILVS